jgi:hypothetical protein
MSYTYRPKLDHAMTLNEVAAEMGITPQGVHSLERSALRKCGKLFRFLGMSGYDLSVHAKHDNAFVGHSDNGDL